MVSFMDVRFSLTKILVSTLPNLWPSLTSHDHLIESAYVFMGRSSLGYVAALISLVTISIVVVEI